MPRSHENQGSPGSYGPVRLGNPFGCVKLNLLRCCGHMQTGGVRVFYGFTTMFWRRGRKNPYGYRTVHVRVRTVHVQAPYVLENTRTIIVRGPCGSRSWPCVHVRVLDRGYIIVNPGGYVPIRSSSGVGTILVCLQQHHIH